MRWFYDASYDYGGGLADAPREVNGFLLHKPSEIHHQLVTRRVVATSVFRHPEPVSVRELSRTHDSSVVAGLRDPGEVALAIEFPMIALLPEQLVWRAVVQPQLCAAGGTCAALRAAADGEWAINLSGGYHHAARNLSHGFCLINDIAIAVARLRTDGARRRILMVDLDLHQGDGNATFFADDHDVYTVSIHEEDIFPIPKARSDLDIGLRSRAGDADYASAIEDALRHAERHFDPQVIVYVAGSDPYERDPLGSLQITKDGLLARDRRVARFARDRGCGLIVVPAGGYSDESPTITAEGFAAIAEIERGTRKAE